MYKFIKIRHDIIKQCHGNYKEMKTFNYKLEIEILEIPLDFRLGARKRPHGKNRGQKQVIFAINHTILGPYLEKSRGQQLILGAYAPGKVEPWIFSLHYLEIM